MLINIPGASNNPQSIDVSQYPHAYTYDGSGNLKTDTMTIGSLTFVKTYTYTGTQLTGETGWVQQ
jgi:YD repeat-containing protein